MAGKRGRPTIKALYYGNQAHAIENIYGNYRTKRSVADEVYCLAAISLIKEAASEIQNIEYIYDSEKGWYSRSILSQLGRMLLQDTRPKEDVLKEIKAAC
jgi:hypothetical protein